MQRIDQLSAVRGNGSNIIPASPDLLRRDPSAPAEIPHDRRRVFLWRAAVRNHFILFPDLFRLDRVLTVL